MIIAVGSFDYLMVAQTSLCLMIFMPALVSQPPGQESLIKVQHGKALNKVWEAAVEKGPENGGVSVEWYNWFKTNLGYLWYFLH